MKDRDKRWIAAAAAIIALLIVVGIVAIIGLANSATSRETQQLVMRLTLESSTATLVAAPAPGAATQEVATRSASDTGFSLSITPFDTPLVADGLSSIPIHIDVTDASLTGRTLTFSVFGGGSVDPPQVAMPPSGETVEVHYVAGQAASNIRVEGTIADNSVQRTSSVAFTSIREFVQITGEVIPHFDANSTTPIPFTLTLLNPDGSPLYGQYRIRVFPTGGQILDPANNTLAAPLDFSVTGAAEPKTLLFVPGISADSGSVQAQILGRSDIPPYTAPVYWNNLTARLDILRGFDSLDVLAPADQVLSWANSSQICVRTYNPLNQLIVPNVLNLRYQVLIAPQAPVIANGENVLNAGQTYSSAERGLSVSANNGVSCLPITTLGDEGGLLRFSFWAERNDLQDEALALIHFGEAALWHIQQPVMLTLPRRDGGQATLTFAYPHTPTIYLLRREERETLLMALWVNAEQIDPVSGELNGSDELSIIDDIDNTQAPLTITNYSPLQQVYVTPLTIQQNGVTYYRVYAAAQAEPGMLPPPPIIAAEIPASEASG